jgi:hypothetical protein
MGNGLDDAACLGLCLGLAIAVLAIVFHGEALRVHADRSKQFAVPAGICSAIWKGPGVQNTAPAGMGNRILNVRGQKWGNVFEPAVPEWSSGIYGQAFHARNQPG